MKIRGQMVTAAAATAILFTATSGIFLSGGSRASFAEPLTADAISAIKAAVDNPSTALATALANMDAVQPGSSDTFKAALENNTDTTGLANAIQQLAQANVALQSTISSALTTLAATPSLASLGTSSGGYLNITNLATPNAQVVASTPPTPPVIQTANGTSPNSSTPDDALPNPAAPGPQAGLPTTPTSPFNPAQPGNGPGPHAPLNPTSPPAPLPSPGPTFSNTPVPPPPNSGRPNSRA